MEEKEEKWPLDFQIYISSCNFLSFDLVYEYRIFSNKRPRRLFKFEALRCGV